MTEILRTNFRRDLTADWFDFQMFYVSLCFMSVTIQHPKSRFSEVARFAGFDKMPEILRGTRRRQK